MAAATEDNQVYFQYVYDLAITAGYDITEAVKLSEMALYKKVFEGIKYNSQYESKIRELLMRKHHQTPHNKEK